MRREWLVAKRNEKEMTTKEVAKLCGVSQAEYSRIENGIRMPRPKLMKAISELLGFDWTLFFE